MPLATALIKSILHRRKRAGASESKSNLANEAWEAPQAIEVVEELIIHNDDLFMVGLVALLSGIGPGCWALGFSQDPAESGNTGH